MRQGAAQERILLQRSAPQFQPPNEADPSIVHQRELNRPPGLLLNDDRPGTNLSVTNNVADLDLHHATAAQLTVDARSKKRLIPSAPMLIKKESDCPDLTGL